MYISFYRRNMIYPPSVNHSHQYLSTIKILILQRNRRIYHALGSATPAPKANGKFIQKTRLNFNDSMNWP
jgi:hypothetical protein